jgi:hypothetical protein
MRRFVFSEVPARLAGILSVGLVWVGLQAGALAAQPGAPLYELDFSGSPGLSTYDWLKQKGFELKQDAADKDKILLSQSDGALRLDVKEQAFGLIIREKDLPGANSLRLHWGVSEYPDGASYQRGVDNEAIMFYVFFGQKKLPSGSMFIPDSPYFLGFFLCQDGSDALEKPYVGHHFKKSGRYICVEHPGTGKTTVTELDLVKAFRDSFDLDHVPAVSGISIEVDTSDSKNDGKASAFLQRVEFLK